LPGLERLLALEFFDCTRSSRVGFVLKRTFHVVLGAFAAATIFAGCGSGGATIGPSPVGATPTPVFSLPPGASPTPTPTATPHGSPVASPTATATPSATPTPTSSPTPLPDTYHPGDNGDSFTMSGSLLVTYDRANQYPTPEPTATVFDMVSQSIAVTNPGSFFGTSAIEFAINETDTQTVPTSQTYNETLDQYFQFTGTPETGNFLDLGYLSTDDNGYLVTVQNGANDELADELPEAAGQTWGNSAGRTVTTNDQNNETSTTTYNDDGSYSGTITYPNAMPSPNPTGSQLTNYATLQANSDGSAMFTTPFIGTAFKYDTVYQLSAPSAAGSSGTITETTTLPPEVGTTSSPTTSTTTIPNWQPATGGLASETDVDNGPQPLPSACPVPAALAGMPNQIVQTKNSVDPLNGELETTTTTTYDTLNVGPICTVIHDVQMDYYDYSGQSSGYFSGSPQQITTLDETLYLSAESLDTIARHPETKSRYAMTRAVSFATAQARITVAHTKARMHRLALAHYGKKYQSYRSFRGLLK
jgi:hypothetical protein